MKLRQSLQKAWVSTLVLVSGAVILVAALTTVKDAAVVDERPHVIDAS